MGGAVHVNRSEKPFRRKWTLLAIGLLMVFMTGLVSSCGGADDEAESEETAQTAQAESHIYDDAQIIEVYNGSGTQVIAYQSLIEIGSDEVTGDALTDWYFNYIEETDYDSYVIVFTDVSDGTGVYGTEGYISVNVVLSEGSDGSYQVSDSDDAITYLPSEDGTLEIYESEDETEDDTEEEEETTTASDSAENTTAATTKSTESTTAATTKSTESTTAATTASTQSTTTATTKSTETTTTATTAATSTYILNTSTMKFHKPSCSSVDQMNEENKLTYTGTRTEVIAMGYEACKRCNP